MIVRDEVGPVRVCSRQDSKNASSILANGFVAKKIVCNMDAPRLPSGVAWSASDGDASSAYPVDVVPMNNCSATGSDHDRARI